MKRTLPRASALLALLAAAPLAAQQRVDYEISFPNAAHHEARVVATFTGAPVGRPLQARMSRSSPGRYALHEFAKNVYDVSAVDGHGRPLAITRPNPHQWDVAGHDGTVRITYTVFGDRTDGTYLGVDPTHAHLNIPATFMWARGFDLAPIRVRFDKPAQWRIATQLRPTADSLVFTAPNLQWFVDSPTEIGPVTFRSWTGTYGGQTYTWRLALHHLGTDAQADTFASWLQRVTREEIAMWGAPPRYDFGTYTFIADYLPWADGDGMEHRNSTIFTGSRPLSTPDNTVRNLISASHEFFHSWNVERLRPRSLEPFDLERANMSGELWFAEGFTNYYDRLFVRRAGLIDDARLATLLGQAVSEVVTSPGRRHFSPVEMSMQAPFVDAATSIDPQNKQNTFISYYTWGEALGAGLDLTLRTRFPGLSLDDYMRAMWREYGQYQNAALAPERPYTVADLRRVLGEVTHDTAFADDFFRRYVEGREVVDYARLFGQAGFLLRKANPGRPWLGAFLENDSSAVRVAQATLAGGSLYNAGIDRGDRIVSIDGVPVTSVDSLAAVMRGHHAGETVRMAVAGRAGPREVAVALVESPELTLVPYEAAGMQVTDAMRALRRQWLGSKVEGR